MTALLYAETILDNCQPLAPLATEVEPKLEKLEGIRAVLFDIYGTLLISASGDIGSHTGDHRLVAVRETCQLFQLELSDAAEVAVKSFESKISRAHLAAKEQGVEYPEVDIVEIWQAALPDLVEGSWDDFDWQRFALEYEVRVNPVWPMPNVESTLSRLAASELVMGIVSNAQFFTPLLFPAFFGKTIEQLGFAPELAYFSYEHRQAKPGGYLYSLAQQQLALQGIEPVEVLYVGNDMLNDVAAAASVGFRTALFAGDQRSLRWRADEEKVEGVVADVIITELPQLIECVAFE
ncbi:MAG: HAD family hydrolase [Planctomycetes bacterium]|nr:HAD family hydrolase [Planctomycetota bacterium]